MGEGFDGASQNWSSALRIEFSQQPLDQRPVANMHLEQLAADSIAQLGHITVRLQIHLLEKNSASQGIAVGVKPAGCQTNHDVPWPDGRAIEDPRFLDFAHNSAAEVIFAAVIKSRHLRRLTAD